MAEAARYGDGIAHSHALAGMILGTVLGAVLVTGAAVLTGGASLAAVAVAAVVTTAAGVAGEGLRDKLAQAGADSTFPAGVIGQRCSADVFINGRPAAVATTSQAQPCSAHPSVAPVAEGSLTVCINGLAAARKGDSLTCGAKIAGGSPDVFTGGGTKRLLGVHEEVPEWLKTVSDIAPEVAGLLTGAGALRQLFSLKSLKLLKCSKCMLGVLAGEAVSILAGGATERLLGQTAYPVDITTGQKYFAEEEAPDFILPLRQPVIWQRYWRSNWQFSGAPGQGWNLFCETSLQSLPEVIIWQSPEGDRVIFPQIPPGSRSYSEEGQCWLKHHQDGSRTLCDSEGSCWHYVPLAQDGTLCRPQRLTDKTGSTQQFIWRDDGLLHSLTDCAGQQLECRYLDTEQGARLHEVWLDGHTCLVCYDYNKSRGELIRVSGRGGRLRRRFSWRDGLLVSHENAAGLRCDYQWQQLEGLPRVVAFRTSAGESASLHYDFAARRREMVREDGSRLHWQLDEQSRVTAFTDADGRQYLLRWRGISELCGITLPDGAQRQCDRDRYARLCRETDELGRITCYDWLRESDCLLRVTYPDGSMQETDYDEQWRIIRHRDENGHTTCYHYPDEYDPLPERITDPHGGEICYEYNHQGLLTRHTGCSGSITQYHYDRFGQLTGAEDAENNTIRRDYNDAGELITLTYADGRQQHISRNGRGQIHSVTGPQQGISYYRYTPHGQISELTDPLARRFRYHHDPRGQLIRLENSNNEEYRFTYDAAGRLLSEQRPDDTEIRCRYNEAGRLAAYLTRGSGERSDQVENWHTLDYDAAGRCTGRHHRDADFTYQYDLRDRLTTLRRTPTQAGAADGGEPDVISLEYDRAGNLLAETTRSGRLTYQYDPLNNLTVLTLPDGEQIQWLRYGSGHVSAIKFAGNLISEFTRDRLHREIRRSSGTKREQWLHYDQDGRRASQHCRFIPQPALPDAEQTDIPRPAASSSGTVSRHYTWSANDDPLTINDSERGCINCRYDAAGRITEQYQTQPVIIDNQIRYDNADNPSSDPHKPPYAPGNRLAGTHDVVYQYDPRGRIISRSDGRNKTQHYRYDEDDRLIHAWGDTESGIFASQFDARCHYDASGRRIRKEVRIIKQVSSEADSTTVTRYLWQGARLLREIREETSIREENVRRWREYRRTCPLLPCDDPVIRERAQERRRSQADQDSTARHLAELHNSEEGRRYTTWMNSEGWHLHPDGSWKKTQLAPPPPEEPYQTSEIRTWLYSPDEPYSPLACCETVPDFYGSPRTRTYWHSTEINGRPLEMWNENGDLVWFGNSDIFGAQVTDPALFATALRGNASYAGKTYQPLRYAGQYLDEETGLHYNLYRYYDPGTGRFIQPDPIGIEGGLNLYAYAPNPLTWIDPWGLSCGSALQKLNNKLKRIKNQSAAGGNRGVTGSVSRDDAFELGKKFVGKNYNKSNKYGSDLLISEDRLRQYRGPSSKSGVNLTTNESWSKTGTQVNFQSRDIPEGTWTNNVHLDVKP